MPMNMKGAFNSRMTTKLIRLALAEGSYDDDNNWVQGTVTNSNIFGVFTSGNKFSQFDEGISIHNTDGGIRISDYRSLYMQGRFKLYIGDKVSYKGMYFNVLQKSDEDEFNFSSFLLEKSENWKP
jgi:hypothetical protein